MENTQQQEQMNDFPYQYIPINPQLHQKKKRSIFGWIFQIIFLCLLPVIIPIRLILIGISLLLNSINCAFINMCSNKNQPLSKFRSVLFRISIQVYCNICLFASGYIMIIKDKRKTKQKPNFYILNHASIFDILINGALGCQCIISSQSVATNIFTRPVLLASRSLITNRANGNNDVFDQIVKRYGTERDLEMTTDTQETTNIETTQQRENQRQQNWPPLTLYPEGVTTNNDCIIRFRTGCFRLMQQVQPIVLKYNQFMPCEWLYENSVLHLLQAIINPINIVQVYYLEQMEPYEGETPRQFADRVGKKMADTINVQYLPYTKNDVQYFRQFKDIDQCTPQYRNDYEWMGQLKDYRKMCKEARIHFPRYEYQKQLLLKNKKQQSQN